MDDVENRRRLRREFATGLSMAAFTLCMASLASAAVTLATPFGDGMVLQLPNTGMAVIHDLCKDLKDIHPTNKAGVGQRLALWALAKAYGRQDLPYSGPIYRSHEIEGRRVRIRFDYAFGGLRSRDGKPLDWFTIAGPNGEFVPAQAQVDGDSVVVWSEQVEQPKAARFAWDETAQPNLVNGAGLPAGPFRTDRPW